MEAQARQVYANLRTALAAVGADFSQVTKFTTYVVNYRPEHRVIVGRLRDCDTARRLRDALQKARGR